MQTAVQVFLISLLLLACILGQTLLLAWLISKATERKISAGKPASHKKLVNVERGSMAWIKLDRPRRQPVAFFIAILSGIACAIGVLLYWIGPFTERPVIGLIGLALGGIGTIVAGILFGTDDRDFYA